MGFSFYDVLDLMPSECATALHSISDSTDVLVAGPAAMVRGTYMMSQRWGSNLKPIAGREVRPSYYIITESGLHVGQYLFRQDITPRIATRDWFTGPEEGPLDYFVSHADISGVRWKDYEGGESQIEVVIRGGPENIVIWLESAAQATGGVKVTLPPATLRESIRAALMDGESPLPDGLMKGCPDCAEMVQYAAKVCRYCGYRFG